MSETSYTKPGSFARGYQAAQTMTAWQAQGGHWAIMDRDAIGEHARPVTADEEAGIAGFYEDFDPSLRITYHYHACLRCNGSGLSWVNGEFGEEAQAYTCQTCGGCGYSTTVGV
jgi:hypothetical protein